MGPINCTDMRYIKLGQGGRWESIALQNSELHFGHGIVSHELAQSQNAVKIRNHLIANDRSAHAVASDIREIRDFYTLGSDCLWITFARGHLWWCFAEPAVTWKGGDGLKHGHRTRKCADGWHNTDINGHPLRAGELSSKLTRVSAFRKTICRVNAADYALRRINGLIEPLVSKSKEACDDLLATLAEAVRGLHWKDLETLIDLIVARSGWQRITKVGGDQKTIDLTIEQPLTRELAAVQIKAAATKAVLAEWLSKIDEVGIYDRAFFACANPVGALENRDREDLIIWDSDQLAASAFKLGLYDWVIEKVG